MLDASQTWLVFATLIMKVIHIGALCLWVAGLVTLAMIFRTYRPDLPEQAFVRFRKLSHYGYIAFVTPAAVVAVGAGIALILLRWIFDPWLLIKLLLVCGLVVSHAYVGHMISTTASSAGKAEIASPWWILGSTAALSVAIFWLVLDKPDVALNLPEWLIEPRQRPWPNLLIGSRCQSVCGFMVPS
jgi:protoporphyrinogen IX oxidase